MRAAGRGVAARGAERGDDLGVAARGSHRRGCQWYGWESGARPVSRARVRPVASPASWRSRASGRLRGARLEHRDGRQRLAFEELEERAAAGGDVADPVGDAELGDRRERVAAAGDRECRRCRDRLGDGPRAARERVELEHADRAVPDDGAGVGDERLEQRDRLRADVEDQVVAARRPRSPSSSASRRRKTLRATASTGIGTLPGIGVEDGPRFADEVGLGERLADRARAPRG